MMILPTVCRLSTSSCAACMLCAVRLLRLVVAIGRKRRREMAADRVEDLALGGDVAVGDDLGEHTSRPASTAR
jgi:hypothetical protein